MLTNMQIEALWNKTYCSMHHKCI